jgi:hypothetical protein
MIISGTLVRGSVGIVTPFFEDSFDSGEKTDANGFTWDVPSGLVTVSDERAYSGSYSLRFEYKEHLPDGYINAEQRFCLGRFLSQYWVEYMLYVPANWVQRDNPWTAESGDNNKFFMTWRDTYSDIAGGTWRIGYEADRSADLKGLFRPMSSRWDFNSWTSTGLDHPQHGDPFIGGTGPVLIGQWNKIQMQFKAATDRTSSDGIMRMWVNGALFGELTTGKFHNFYETPADASLYRGYFLGYSNSGFTDPTVFFIDDVKFYDVDPGW